MQPMLMPSVGRLRRFVRAFAWAGSITGLLFAFLCGAVLVTAFLLGPPPLAATNELSPTVVDRGDRLLRAFTTGEGLWRLPVEPADVDPRYVKILLAFEDRRFWRHKGVDALALTRAMGQFLRFGRAVSGGSTLTMQVARLVDRRHDRTLITKWSQLVRALQLEAMLSKRDILRLYLRLAPFGGNIEGVRAASLAYFGKEPRRLSLAESALLVALPQSPEARRPDRSPLAARRARDRVLSLAARAGVINAAEADRAMAQPVPDRRQEFPKLAPHLAEALVAGENLTRPHAVTLDRDLQVRLEALAKAGAQALGNRLSVGMIAADHRTGEILAHVGSSDYFDTSRLGAIDMTGAIRSPGSTMKPLIYGLAFEQGLAHPETFIEDRPVQFGLYAPKNFDNDFRGTVTVRESLSLSLNIPSVKLLHAVGPGRLVGRLRQLGLDPRLPEASIPTLAVALGGFGMTLMELTELYAGIARGGRPVKLRHHPSQTGNRKESNYLHGSGNVLSPVAAWYIADILKNAPPPIAASTGQIAYKTGTSYGYRDAWAIGFDGRHTVGVWVGRADATSTAGLTGRTAAAPLLFDAFKRIAKERVPLRPAPAGVLRVSGADLPPPLKRFNEGSEEESHGPFIDPPVRIAFPPDRSEVESEAADAPIVLKASGGVLPLTWMIDDAPLPASQHTRTMVWEAKSRGFIKVSVIDAKGRVDRVTVRLK